MVDSELLPSRAAHGAGVELGVREAGEPCRGRDGWGAAVRKEAAAQRATWWDSAWRAALITAGTLELAGGLRGRGGAGRREGPAGMAGLEAACDCARDGGRWALGSWSCEVVGSRTMRTPAIPRNWPSRFAGRCGPTAATSVPVGRHAASEPPTARLPLTARAAGLACRLAAMTSAG